MKRIVLATALSFAAVALLPALSWPIVGNGKPVSMKRDLADFSSIKVAAPVKVKISEALDCACEVTIDSNLQEYLLTEVRGGRLTISFRTDRTITKVSVAEVKLSLPALSAVEATGASKVELVDRFESVEFLLKLNGASSFYGSLDMTIVGIEASGAATIDLRGSAAQMAVDLDGASRLSLDMELEGLSGKVKGASRISAAEVDIRDLDISAVDASSVTVGRVIERAKLDLRSAASFSYRGGVGIEGKVSEGFVTKRD